MEPAAWGLEVAEGGCLAGETASVDGAGELVVVGVAEERVSMEVEEVMGTRAGKRRVGRAAGSLKGRADWLL